MESRSDSIAISRDMGPLMSSRFSQCRPRYQLLCCVREGCLSPLFRELFPSLLGLRSRRPAAGPQNSIPNMTERRFDCTMEMIRALPWESKNPSVPPLSNKTQNKGTQEVRRRTSSTIVRQPGRPVISVRWVQEGFTVEPARNDSGANFQWNDSGFSPKVRVTGQKSESQNKSQSYSRAVAGKNTKKTETFPNTLGVQSSRHFSTAPSQYFPPSIYDLGGHLKKCPSLGQEKWQKNASESSSSMPEMAPEKMPRVVEGPMALS